MLQRVGHRRSGRTRTPQFIGQSLRKRRKARMHLGSRRTRPGASLARRPAIRRDGAQPGTRRSPANPRPPSRHRSGRARGRLAKTADRVRNWNRSGTEPDAPRTECPSVRISTHGPQRPGRVVLVGDMQRVHEIPSILTGGSGAQKTSTMCRSPAQPRSGRTRSLARFQTAHRKQIPRSGTRSSARYIA